MTKQRGKGKRILTIIACLLLLFLCAADSFESVPVRAVYVICPAFDADDVNKLMEHVKYSFVAVVEGVCRTEYEAEGWPMPTTIYTVRVLENIKGVLPTDGTIEIAKYGGVSENKKHFYMQEDDMFPAAGHTYVFNVFAGNGRIPLASMGSRSVIPVEEHIHEQLQNGGVLQEVLDTSEVVRRYRAAYQAVTAGAHSSDG